MGLYTMEKEAYWKHGFLNMEKEVIVEAWVYTPYTPRRRKQYMKKEAIIEARK